VFLSDLLSGDAIPALEMTARFAAQRQDLIAHNIANLETPNFQPMDASPVAFQRMLGKAIDDRRARDGGRLEWPDSREVRHVKGTRDPYELRLTPRTPSGNILFHDRNNRDEVRLMQDLVENASVFRISTDLLRNRYAMVNNALAERII
jgi:flagellar basal-body rod protein FlgB